MSRGCQFHDLFNLPFLYFSNWHDMSPPQAPHLPPHMASPLSHFYFFVASLLSFYSPIILHPPISRHKGPSIDVPLPTSLMLRDSTFHPMHTCFHVACMCLFSFYFSYINIYICLRTMEILLISSFFLLCSPCLKNIVLPFKFVNGDFPFCRLIFEY